MPSVDIVERANGDAAHPLASPSSPLIKLYAPMEDDSVKPVDDQPTDQNGLSNGHHPDDHDEADAPPLQLTNENMHHIKPIPDEDLDPDSFNLVEPGVQNGDGGATSGMDRLEQRSELLFSQRHLQAIFEDSSQLNRFSTFLYRYRPGSVPLFTYYLDALKALRAIHYSNSILGKLKRLDAFDFTHQGEVQAAKTANQELQAKADAAFEMLTREDLPMYITHTWIQVVTQSVRNKIIGTPRHEAEGLAEVFCLTDPSRADNPIVFMSEEFNRTTQYGVDYVIGRNCRFLQGPRTNPFSVKRIRDKLAAGFEHFETFLNYRRDGSTFMNLVMMAPLYDSRGVVRYFIGAQVDVSGLAMGCYNLSALKRLTIEGTSHEAAADSDSSNAEPRDDCTRLAEILSPREVDTMRSRGGDMFRLPLETKSRLRLRDKTALAETEGQDDGPAAASAAYNNPNNQDGKNRVVIADPGSPSATSPSGEPQQPMLSATPGLSAPSGGRLAGIYEKYLLVRPYPSMRILFCSPAMRVPGILQSPLLERISCSRRAGEQLLQALAAGVAVTAKVRWLTVNHKGSSNSSVGESLASSSNRRQTHDSHSTTGDTASDGSSVRRTDAAPPPPSGKVRWLHCTPLVGSNGKVGVWMVVLVDDEAGSRQPAKPITITGPPARHPVDQENEPGTRNGAPGAEGGAGPGSRPRMGPRTSSETLGLRKASAANGASHPPQQQHQPQQYQQPSHQRSFNFDEPQPRPSMTERSPTTYGVPMTNGFSSVDPPAGRASEPRRMNIGSILGSRQRRHKNEQSEPRMNGANGNGSEPAPLMSHPPTYPRQGYRAKVTSPGQNGNGTKSVETISNGDGSSVNTVRIEEA